VTCISCRAQLDEHDDKALRLEALFVLAITMGLRPGELRGLTWDLVDLVDLDNAVIKVWRSARKGGDTKTPASKRTLELTKRAVKALIKHKALQASGRVAAGSAWRDDNLVFCHEDGTCYTGTPSTGGSAG
jgi:integrase